MLSAAILLLSLLGSISQAVYSYGYPALFILMLLESASLPIPSEVVLPLAGLLAAKGVLNAYVAFAIILAAETMGMAIDYYLALLLGKEVVYRHLQAFRIKKADLDAFYGWFERNGPFAVFIGRFIPEVRGLVSFPAGFAMMPKKRFFAYSIAGTLIWDAALISFGYYALNSNSIYLSMIAAAVFAMILYVLFKTSLKRMKR